VIGVTGLVVPLREWEALQSKLEEECLIDDEIKEAEQSWRDYPAGKGEPIKQVMKELLEVRKCRISETFNYLKTTGFEIGLLINFGTKSLEYKRLIYSH
jgi:hypothetical protein